MKKILACLLALPLTLAACGAQTADTGSTPPTEPTQTTETAAAASTPAGGTASTRRRTGTNNMMKTNTEKDGMK